jgi:superoxide dismutase
MSQASWFQRLRGNYEESSEDIEMRLEASAILPEGLTSTPKKGAPTTFIPDMILEEVNARDNINHIAKVIKQDPIAARIVYGIAEKVFDDWFVLRTADGEEHPLNAEIQREFTRLRAKHYFTMALAGERGFGHTWLQVIREKKKPLTIDTTDSEQKPLRVAALDFWTPQQATVYKYDPNNGAPAQIRIKYKVGIATENTLEVDRILEEDKVKDMILIRTRPYDRSHAGRPIIGPVWDYLVYLRYLFHAVTWYAMKVGLGWLYVKVRKLTDKKRIALENNFKAQSPKRFLVLDSDVEDINFVQSAGGNIDFPAYAAAILDQIAAGVDMPVVSLTGQAQGSIAGGEGIEKALYSTINSAQQAFEPYIREVILKMHYDDSDMFVSWNTRFAHDEKQQAEIEVAHVSAQVARLGYMTMNEVRSIDKLGTVEGGDESPAKKEDPLSQFSQAFGKNSPESQEQNKNPEGDQLG